GVAYVPAFASPFLSSNALQMAIVMIATMAMTCLTTIIANRFKPVVQSESTTTAVNSCTNTRGTPCLKAI
ncbi:TPA: hypothetical protein ACTD17_004489, partial [Salmonella enterica subsp. enterica]